jgi:DNA-binding transcriptional MerR regulator
MVFESGKAAEIVGIPERTLRYWATIKLIEPVREAEGRPGIRRGYSFDNLVEAAILRELSKQRVNVTQSREVLDKAHKAGLGKNGNLCTIRIVDGTRVEVLDLEEVKKSTLWSDILERFAKKLETVQTAKRPSSADLTDVMILDHAQIGLMAKSIIYGSETSVIIPIHSLWMEIFERVSHGG